MYEINWWWDGMLNNVIYDYLIFPDPTTFEERPYLAHNWTVESWTAPGDIDGLKITFKIHDNATWHDGLPVTAEDVAFTWLYAQSEENPVYLPALMNLVDAEALDATTVVGYLNTTSYWALHWLGWNIPIIPKHIWEDISDSTTYQPLAEGKLIGSGPYRFKEYRPGEYVIVEHNPTYWQKPVDSTLGYETLTLTQGDSRTFKKTLTYLDTPITNGTFLLTVSQTTGEVVTTVEGSVETNGTYSATLDTTDIQPGTYLFFAELSANVTGVTGAGLGSRDEYQLIVQEEAPPPPTDYTPYYIGGAIVVVVIIAAGYLVIRRR
jgi:ABC-type transport system substrate-binding protein